MTDGDPKKILATVDNNTIQRTVNEIYRNVFIKGDYMRFASLSSTPEPVSIKPVLTTKAVSTPQSKSKIGKFPESARGRTVHPLTPTTKKHQKEGSKGLFGSDNLMNHENFESLDSAPSD